MTLITSNSLGQSTANAKAKKPYNLPDNDSEWIIITNGDTAVYPNLVHDHTRMEYICPVGNLVTVNFYAPINTEDRGLHWIVIDNSNNTGNKTFIFSGDYIFLDDPSNLTNTYILAAGKKLIWYGTYTGGKLQLRVASESTN
jgi:hypothetical protein